MNIIFRLMPISSGWWQRPLWQRLAIVLPVGFALHLTGLLIGAWIK